MIKAQQVIVCDEIPKGSGSNIFSPYRLTTKIVSLDGETICESDPCSYPIEKVETMLMKMAQMYFNDLMPFKKDLRDWLDLQNRLGLAYYKGAGVNAAGRNGK